MPALERFTDTCFLIPTAGPESDRTFGWDSTTLVLSEVEAAGITRLGYTYEDRSTAVVDHARLEQMLFDGALQPRAGMLQRDVSRPGPGLELKCADAARYAA